MTVPSAAMNAVGYLGPAGTFTEQALYTQPDLISRELRPLSSIIGVLRGAASGEIATGFVAIENAIEGSVTATIDTLMFEDDLLIQREVEIPISMNLLVRPGADAAGVKKVMSYPHALAQVRQWLGQNMPEAEIIASNSTADAARQLSESDDPTLGAIAPARSAEVYGLDIGAEEIEDHPENKTRFIVVERNGVPAPTGHDKTSLAIFQRSNEPGSLLAILQEFAARNIDLTKLESRPTKASLGDYAFLIDMDGHIADEVVSDALRSVQAKHARVKFLGSYPAAGDHGEDVRSEANAAWAAADSWIAELRSQIR